MADQENINQDPDVQEAMDEALSETIIVKFCSILFNIAKQFSILNIYFAYSVSRGVRPNRNAADLYVLSWVTILLAVLVVGGAYQESIIKYGVVLGVLATYRLLDIIQASCNVIIFDRYRDEKRGKKYYIYTVRRSFLLLVFNFCETILIFAVIYQYYIPDRLCNFCLSRYPFIDSVYFSIVTATTLGFGYIHPYEWLGRLFCGLQNIVSFFMVVLILSKAISLLEPPKQKRDIQG